MLRQHVEQLRELPPYYYREASADAGRRLTAAPLTLAEGCSLLQILKLMRLTNFPTSQLQGLVAALQVGRHYGAIYYLYQQARLDARLGEGRRAQNVLARLPQIWPFAPDRDVIPWHRATDAGGDDIAASVLPDLLELYPFVPRFAGLSADARKVALEALWNEMLTEAPNAR
jgi:hypothetical protein